MTKSSRSVFSYQIFFWGVTQRRRSDEDEYIIPHYGLELLYCFDALTIGKNLDLETFDRAKEAEDDDHPSSSPPYPLLSNNVS